MKNVVFIVMDSMRKDKVGAYNDEVDFTENIDSFADDAAVFEDAVANSSWTLPVHATFFTGMYPWNHEATQKNLELDVEEDLLAEKFSQEGYETGCFSVNGFLKEHSGLVDGFDQVENLGFQDSFGVLDNLVGYGEKWISGEEGLLQKLTTSIGDKLFHYFNSEMRETEEILEKSQNFIEESDDFFLFLNLMDAHEPYMPPEEYRKKHGSEGSITQDPSDYYSGKECDFEAIQSYYDASVDYMDDQIGELFNYLKEKGYWEDTIVVLASDHGQLLGEDNHYGHQYTVHEKLISVPLIVKGGEETDKQVELRELYDLIPGWAEIEDSKEPGTRIAKGMYEFPDMMINRIPEEQYERLYRKHIYARTPSKKTVLTETENGEKQINSINTEEKIEAAEDLVCTVEDISQGKSVQGSDFESKDEQVKEKLEALGYG